MMRKSLQLCLLLLMVGKLQGELATLKDTEILKLRTRITSNYIAFIECVRQSNSTRASGGSSGEALHSDLQCFKGTRRVSQAGPLARCPEPDPAELPARPKRQCERTAACGARLLPEGHLGHHHPQGGLP